MKRIFWSVLLTLAMLVGVFTVFSSSVLADPGGSPGAVYAMTNTTANAVVMFNRSADGTLNNMKSFLTGGAGIGAGGPDTLGSQGSLLLTQDGKWLLAVNAQSNDITVFRVKQNSLDMVDKVSSGGTMPTSLTISGNEVFVLNDGTPNITGFTLSNKGDLDPIWHSTRSLPTTGTGNFGQVGFDNSGKWLVVTDKADNAILVYPMGWNQLPAMNPITYSYSTLGGAPVPFSFTFDVQDNLLVVEVWAGGTIPATVAPNGAVSSFDIMRDGTLKPISLSVHNMQAAACWIAANQMGYVFTTNSGSNDISSYKEKNSSGKLMLLNGDATTAVPSITPLDVGISNNGRFLYALDPGNGGIDGFQIAHDGTLTSVGTFYTGTFMPFAQGIAVQ